MTERWIDEYLAWNEAAVDNARIVVLGRTIYVSDWGAAGQKVGTTCRTWARRGYYAMKAAIP